MGKNKLKRWAELLKFERVFQPARGPETLESGLKGHWHDRVFHNDHQLVLEIGCGRGEYCVNLGLRYPGKNFVGIDIKGARLWRGAKTGHENGMTNLAFLRIQAEMIGYFFNPSEVSEIWLTFPDPQVQESRERKRLTHPGFLKQYRQLLKPGGLLHLKTDSAFLFEYTLEVLKQESGRLMAVCPDVYRDATCPRDMDIQTTYEKMFAEKGMTIKYLCFSFF